jgi:hypothetical protein
MLLHMAQIRPAKDPSNNAPLGCILAFTLMWTLFVIPFFVATVFGGGEEGPDRGCVLLFMIPFLLADFGLLYISVRGIRTWVARGRYLLPPEVRLNPPSVRVNESFDFQYRVPLRRDVTVEAAAFQFLLRESATYRQGTDTTTVTHDRWTLSWQVAPGRYSAGQALDGSRRLTVPREAMHTFVGKNNRLQWFVKVELRLAGWPPITEFYEVPVRPERLP